MDNNFLNEQNNDNSVKNMSETIPQIENNTTKIESPSDSFFNELDKDSGKPIVNIKEKISNYANNSAINSEDSKTLLSKNISIFFLAGKVVRIISFIIAGLCCLAFFIMLFNLDDEVIPALFGVIFGVALSIVFGILAKAFFDWKALMLQQINEINQKTK